MRTRAALLATAALVLTAGSAASAVPAKKAPPTPTCLGKHATKVLKANGKTLTGTKKNDVLVASGKNDTVIGLGGNDLICVTKPAKKVDAGSGNDKVQLVSGVVLGGDGNDVITQKGSGKVAIDAGKGSDTVTLTNPAAGSSLVGGPDPDAFIVPSALLTNVAIPVTSGDRLNGINLSVEQPAAGAPTFLWTVEQKTPNGDVIPTTVLPSDQDLVSNPDRTQVTVGSLAYAPGRDPASWSISYGDGTTTDGGQGPPPANLGHSYLTAGTYAITLTVTDDRGAATTKSATVHAAAELIPIHPTLTYTSAGATATFTVAAAPTATSDLPTSWDLDFGDGTEKAQSGSPDTAVIVHAYPTAGTYRAQLHTEAADGAPEETNALVNLGADRTLSAYLTTTDRVGASARLVSPHEDVFMFSSSQGYDSYSIDEGDGTPVASGQGTEIAYGKPGTYALTLIGHRAGFADDKLVMPITVVDPPSHVVETAPTFATEGPVTWGLAGTVVAPGAVWTLYDPRRPQGVSSGSGPLPAALTYVLSGRHDDGAMSIESPYDLRIDITNPPLPLTDTTTLRYRVRADTGVSVTPLGTHLEDVDVNGYPGEYRGTDFNASVFVDASATAPVDVRVTSRTFSLDGVTQSLSGAASDTFGSLAAPVGEHTLIALVHDSAGGTARAITHVSIAAAPTLTTPASPVNTSHFNPTPVNGISETVAANARPLAWHIDFGDGTSQQGYGTIPSSFAHPLSTPMGYTINIHVSDDHGRTVAATYTVHTV